MFGIHCVLIFLEHALGSLSLRSEASKDTGGLSFLHSEKPRDPRAGAEPLPLPHQTVLILQREAPSVVVPRNETLLNPEEKPQEEKNTAQLQLGLRLQPLSPLLPAQRVCLHYRPGGKVCQSGTAFQVPKDPSDREECGLGTVAGPTPALKPEVGGGQSSPWGGLLPFHHKVYGCTGNPRLLFFRADQGSQETGETPLVGRWVR